MKFLNLGCGGERTVSPEWINLDDLHSQLPVGTPARDALDSEPNYVNFVVLSEPLPFDDESMDSILASHFFEHFNTQDSLKILKDCFRLLKTGGTIVVSVPDASYFRSVYAEDNNKNWERLFGVVDPKNPIPTFMEAALFFEQHLQLFTEDSLWCLLTQAGYKVVREIPDQMSKKLNRLKFSLILTGVK